METFDDKEHACCHTPMGGLLVICLLAVAMPIAASPTSDAAMTHKAITDNAITLAVEGDLNIGEGVMPNFIDVITSDGIVTLSGSVTDLLAKKRAVKIAESIRGVRAVVDRISVMPVSRPDEDIRKDVLMTLLQDPATESYKVGVSVKDAVVTLIGSVGSSPEAQLAKWIAEGVEGVKEVRNDLKIDYQTKRTDGEIAADINDLLQWDIWVNGLLIHIDVKNGQVALTGAVGSAIERARAAEDAWVSGVTSVDYSGLKVEPWARDEGRREHRFVVKSDEEIKQAVQADFRHDPRVSPFSLNVTVEGGVAFLSGTVSNLKAKTAAEQDSSNTIGVSWVENFLKVRPENPPINADIEKNLRAALLRDPRLDGSQIEVAVINHATYLGGWVNSAFQRAEAQDVASRTKGVVEVRNHLKIEPDYSLPYYNYNWPNDRFYSRSYSNYDWSNYEPYSPSYSNHDWPNYEFGSFAPQPPKNDAQIKKDIEKAFYWSPFVDRDDITVTVHDGVAMLRGTVGGWLAYGEADRDARKGGAMDVINRLNVKKGAWF